VLSPLNLTFSPFSQDYDPAYNMVREKRNVCRPNVGFMCQLISWRKRCQLPCPDDVRRLYRVASHAPKDRMRVVAKWVDKVDSTSLDSRAVCVLQTSSAVFLLVGRGCQLPELFVAIAWRHIRYLQLHEHASSTVHVVYEGAEETSDSRDFWTHMQCPSGSLAVPFNHAYDEDYLPYSYAEIEVLRRELQALRREAGEGDDDADGDADMAVTSRGVGLLIETNSDEEGRAA
jgi:hypothetical protein